MVIDERVQYGGLEGTLPELMLFGDFLFARQLMLAVAELWVVVLAYGSFCFWRRWSLSV